MGWGQSDSPWQPLSWGLQPPRALALVAIALGARPFSSPPPQLPCWQVSLKPPLHSLLYPVAQGMFQSSSDYIAASLISSMAFHGPKEKIQALCDLHSLAHLSHLFSASCPSPSASCVPPTCSPITGLLHVLFPLTVMFFPNFFLSSDLSLSLQSSLPRPLGSTGFLRYMFFPFNNRVPCARCIHYKELIPYYALSYIYEGRDRHAPRHPAHWPWNRVGNP